MYRLSPMLTAELLSQPESGMGYQLVEALLSNQKIERAIAYNAELVVLDSEPQVDLTKRSHDELLALAEKSKEQVRSLKVLSRINIQSTVRESGSGTSKSGGPAILSPIEKTAGEEVFKRFSAYVNDRRLTPDQRWLPGTYATTAADATHVRTGADAVKRYALPNPAPASYVFTGTPKPGTDIQRGVAMPLFGQPGGGVEVIFPTGTQPFTVKGPVKIPDV